MVRCGRCGITTVNRLLVSRLGGRFLHLTQGFEVVRDSGEQLCTLVDDVTIVADLDGAAAAPPGWHRLLTDDARLLELLARLSDPAGPLDTSLDAVACAMGRACRADRERVAARCGWRDCCAGHTVRRRARAAV